MNRGANTPIFDFRDRLVNEYARARKPTVPIEANRRINRGDFSL